jgi:homotetrameric cytidine deaminase
VADDELTAADRDLVAAARGVSGRAYVPASGFAVGCAVRTGSGRTFVGCNVENASYGLTICAERAAITAAVAAEGPRPLITAVAVHTDSATCSPCGACRQVIAELGPEAVVVYRRDGRFVRRSIAELLPDAFTFPG